MIIPKILKDFFSYKNDGPQNEIWEQKSKTSGHTPKYVSQPVISFVKTFLQNPRRFKLEISYSSPYGSLYKLTDKNSNLNFRVAVSRSFDAVEDHHYTFNGLPFTLSKQEKQYLIDNVVQYYIDREKRYKELVEKIARKRLYEVYK